MVGPGVGDDVRVLEDSSGTVSHPRIGAHLPLAKGMVRAAERAHVIGADAVQIFIDNPSAWRRRADLPAELPAWRERIATLGLGPIAVHAPYLVNLAGPEDEFFARSVAVLAHELRAAPAYGARLVNAHIGSHRDAGPEAGLARLADGISRVLDQVPLEADGARLVLENSAGGGYAMGSSLEELEAILVALDERGVALDRVAFCLDTAHLWGAGYDLADPEASDALIDEFDHRIGLGRLAMIHLNDSRAARGSKADRHQHVGGGQIGETGLGALLRHRSLGSVPFFLETPGMDEGFDAVNVERVRALLAGRVPLPTLSVEALELTGRSSRSGPERAALANGDPTA
jgi:deoxyribonuclease-4